MTANHAHTPTVDELRRIYALKVPHDQRDRRNAEFDRFLAAVEQRGAERGWDEGYGACWDYHMSEGMIGTVDNPYSADQEDEDV